MGLKTTAMNTPASFFLFLFFIANTIMAQDSIRVIENSSNKIIRSSSKILDTIIDGDKSYKIEIAATPDSLAFKKFGDNELAANIDKKWLDLLYNNTLFDTINRAITNLEYSEVYYPDLPTDTLKYRLDQLNSKTPFNIEYNPSLESVIKSFLKNRRQYFEKMLGLSQFYFPMFERELDNYNVPLEVKYLAIVESALKPRARSRAGATGLWQFMFTTGKHYGLDVSSYVDERSDPIKSTEAAAKYLASLYKIFGDWDLALAAYNSGPGNVSKAIRRSGGYQNYWNIRHNLPRETAGYLPAFLATMYIMEFAAEHGFKSQKPMFRHIETDTILVKQMITLDQVSEATGVNIEELQFLNPSYKLDIIPYIKGENYTLRLPRTAIGLFVNNEVAIYKAAQDEFNTREKPLPQFFDSNNKIRYRVKSGDYLGKIARKYGVRVSQIKQWNGLRSNNLSIGQRLTLYPRNKIPTSKTTTSSSNSNRVSTNKSRTYTVRNGDSLWSISKKFPGVSIQNIQDWNDISGSRLKPGMKLIISKS